MGNIIDGKALAAKIKAEIKEAVSGLNSKPGLAVIQVGDDPASKVYVGGKEKDALEVGFHSEIHRLPADSKQETVIELVKNLNEKKEINGILVQLPLPKHLNEELITNSIDPLKDVDGFTYNSAGRLFTGSKCLVACTPSGCIEMIKSAGCEIKGKNAVVIGRSNIVGKPMAILLLQEHATVTICHSRTQDLASITSKADILVAAIGKTKFVKSDMVKQGAVVIDVGMNRDENGKLCGDVDFENVKDKASFITPVPGGVGLMTRAMLMKNTLEAYKMQLTGG
ncbi:MAG: bifunctional methylenetetrahydrofolate dehydrogenase/methenyltetrahydrofolate cyclohydrolase FolD [Candidatus Goldiibacteriota bacterium HGW-Goldbacteria-1]|jgi:methylenetetrahydrofolate dehydrogenase (NADP+)/methenyltetrahydrofolate cyclohydrolase|nr:MAG: bifunctional methylenetetrahydrofolate dehydrogenase/methenyltetrahydrofolate cyclohydrolase FolD [Candidatus Goldiibacteriota bacterium HGW-Goldbacteria-1]